MAIRSPSARAAAAAALAFGAACEGPFVFNPPGPPTVASVALTPDSAQIVTGETLSFTLVVRDSAGSPITGRAVSWSASAPGVVSISTTGVAIAQAPGTAVVSATVEGKADSADVTVVPFALTRIAAGGLHTCAVANTAAVYCWGSGIYGQLGGGFVTLAEALPVPAAGATRFRDAAAGGDHACGLADDSTGACWGRNSASQLGRGLTTGDVTQPAPVAGGLRFATIAGGERHSCAITSDGTAYCWGGNTEGQLGDSQAMSRAVPTAVAGGHRFVRLAAGGRHSCAIAAGGTAWCWGADDRGQLGDSVTGGNRGYPARVRGASGFRDVAAGGSHSCGLIAAEIVCWGDNARGQLGNGTEDSLAVAPVAVAGGFTAIAVTAGGRHTCALAADSTAHCWGANDRGQIGDGSTTDRPTPVPVAGARRFTRLTAGAEHTCGITPGGVAYCWGAGTDGQLGAGTMTDNPTPVAVVQPEPATSR